MIDTLTQGTDCALSKRNVTIGFHKFSSKNKLEKLVSGLYSEFKRRHIYNNAFFVVFITSERHRYGQYINYIQLVRVEKDRIFACIGRTIDAPL